MIVRSRAGGAPAVSPAPDSGATLIELLTVLTLVAFVCTLAVPVTGATIDASRARQAAGFVAARVRWARQHAVFRTAATALLFDQTATGWAFRVCVDGNGNGLRRAELVSGKDTCVEGPYDLSVLFGGIKVALDGTIPGPEGDPASTDPVHLGRSDLVSCTPSGTCTPGTLFLRSPHGAQYAVRVAGATGRTRVLRYEPSSRTWSEM